MDKYLNKYYNYFLNIAGGAWEKSEITYLDNPTSAKLKLLVSEATLDYTLSIFIGHGGLQESKQLFQINQNEIIKVGQFINGSPKQMIIFESCRTTIQNIPTADISDKPPIFKDGGRVRAPLKRSDAKNLYEKSINECQNGLVVCFACDANQTASNFYFSYGLISVAMKWHLDSKNHLQNLPITNLMEHLSGRVNTQAKNQIGETQTPVYTGDIPFPFSISKY